MTLLSVLDLAPVAEGSTPADALRNALDLARHAEAWGYRRYWLAEHHNMVGIASAATAVVIAYVAGGTNTIRVGSGGIMLPNHSPLVIAEQFGTLETLYPGRIDLGLGRAPGTDPRTVRALRRGPDSAERFPQDVLELQALLAPLQPGQVVQPYPVPGSKCQSGFSVRACSGRSSRRRSDCPLPSLRISHPMP
jgi:luciferase family oxidoreductase group 1